MPSFGAFLAGFPEGYGLGAKQAEALAGSELDRQEKLREALAKKAYGEALPDIAGLQGIADSGQPQGSSSMGAGPTPGRQPMGGGPPGVGSYAPPVAPQMGGPPSQPYSVMGGAQPDTPYFLPPSQSPPPGVRPTMPNLTGPPPVYPPRGGPPDPATQQQFMRDNPAFRPPLAPSVPGAASGMPGQRQTFPAASGGMPGGGQAPPAASGGMPQPQQPLTLERVVQAITKNNPGIRPDVLAGAIQLATKDMLPFEQLKARQYSLDLRERDFNERVREFEVTAEEKKAEFRIRQEDRKSVAEEKKAEAQDIGDSIINAEQPPDLKYASRLGPEIRDHFAKKGFNLTQAQLEWKALEKQINSVNAPQPTRFRQAATQLDNTVNEVIELSKQLNQHYPPAVNRAFLAEKINLEPNSEGAKLAVRYLNATDELKTEFANVNNSGYAPTVASWKNAEEQVNRNYTMNELEAALRESQKIIQYRVNAMNKLVPVGPGGIANRYLPAGGTPAGGAPAGGAPTGGAPAGAALPPGWSIKKNDERLPTGP